MIESGELGPQPVDRLGVGLTHDTHISLEVRLEEVRPPMQHIRKVARTTEESLFMFTDVYVHRSTSSCLCSIWGTPSHPSGYNQGLRAWVSIHAKGSHLARAA